MTEGTDSDGRSTVAPAPRSLHSGPVRLENIVWDSRDPHLLGRFWAAALGAEPDDGGNRISSKPD